MPIFSSFVAAIAAEGFIAALTTTAIGKLLTGVAFNALASALFAPDAPKNPDPAGIVGEIQQGVVPRSIILGTSATAGSLVYHNHWGGETNEYYTRITALCDLPVGGLAEIWIDGEKMALSSTPDPGGKGYPIVELSTVDKKMVPVAPTNLDRDTGTTYQEVSVSKVHGWIKFYDGTQTTADQFVINNVATTERPWTANDVGHGVAYAIATFKANPKLFKNFPQIVYAVDGILMYDPVSETTGPSSNPAVQARHILNGISYGDQWLYGPQSPGYVDDAELAAEIAKCNQPVPGAAGMTNAEKIAAFGSTAVPAQYRCGIEIEVDRPVTSALEDILTSCNGRITEIGARYRFQVGDPGPSVASFTDLSVVTTEKQHFAPFFPLADTINGVTATYPEPLEGWQTQEAPPLYSDVYEAEDGNRRLPTSIPIPSVPYREQVQRLMSAALAEARRARRLTVTLLSWYWTLEPGDFVTWNSERNGFVDKLFRVDGVEDHENGDITVDLTEVDPNDYNWTAATDYRPVAHGSVSPQALPDFAIPGWRVFPMTLRDGAGNERRPAIGMQWSAIESPDVRAIEYHIRKQSDGLMLKSGTFVHLDSLVGFVDSGVIPGETYEVNAKLISRTKQTAFTGWIEVEVPAILIGPDDLSDEVTNSLFPDAPGIPQNLAINSILDSDGRATLVMNWDAVSGATGYELGITENGGNQFVIPSGENSYGITDVRPNIHLEVVVRAVGSMGDRSGWSSPPVTHTVVKDTTPPPVPTLAPIVEGVDTLWLSWSLTEPPDLERFEVYESTTATPAPTLGTEATFTSLATVFARSGLPDTNPRHYWVRAVDSSGNKSAWSARKSGATSGAPELTSEDLAGLVDNTSFATGLAAVEILGALPTTGNFDGRLVVLTTDWKLYRYDGDAEEFTSKVDGADIVADSVASAAIQAGAINTRELAAGAVMVRHLGIGDFTNYAAGSDFEVEDRIPWALGSNMNRTTTVTYGGSAGALRIGGGSSNGYLLGEGIECHPGEQFYVSFWSRCDGNWNGADNNSKLRFGNFDGGSLVGAVAYNNGESVNSWIQKTGVITVPSGCYRLGTSLGCDATVGQQYLDNIVIRRMNGGEVIVDGALKARHVSVTEEFITNTAQIKNGIISNAKITDLSADKLLAGTALTSSLTVSGTALSSIRNWANDPAARINAASTQILPGKIVISGGTTLDDWRKSGDTTKIDGGKISTNTVDTAQLNANSVKTAQLAAGAATLDKLAVGQGRNLYNDSQFALGTELLRINGAGSSFNESSLSMRLAGDSWAGKNFETLMLVQAGSSSNGYTDILPRDTPGSGDNRQVPAEGGKWYEASVYVSTHRCTGSLYMRFMDADGAQLSAPVTAIPESLGSSNNPDLWQRVRVHYQAPSGTAFVQMFIRKYGTLSGTSSYLFLHKPMIAESHAQATEPAPWSPGGQTLISGDMIKTGLVDARRVKIDSFTISSDGSGNLIVKDNGIGRVKIIAGALTDGGIDQSPTQGYRNHNTVACEIYIGPVKYNEFWHFAGVGELKGPGRTAAWEMKSELVMQYRTLENGTWSSFRNVWYSGVRHNEEGWVDKSDTYHFASRDYDNVHVRLVVTTVNHNPNSSPSTVTFPLHNTRNLALIIQSMTRR
jgi:hypothetical protein